MKWMVSIAAGISAAFVMSATAAYASACHDTCDDTHLTCQRSGADEAKCLDGWHQCRQRCDTPTVQKTSLNPAPTPHPAKTTTTTAPAQKPH